MKEVNHRVNNSLSIVASMLRLQGSVTQSTEVRDELREAGNRIAAIARAHQHLYRTDRIDALDLGAYLTDVCKALDESLPACEIVLDTEQGIEIGTDRAITAALLVNELVTNSAKHAHPAGSCRIWLALSRGSNGSIIISVRDKGVGLPQTFNLKSGRGLGMRLVDAFSQQLQADLQVIRRDPGAEFIVTLPL